MNGTARRLQGEDDLRGRYPREVNEALFDLVGSNFGRQVRETEFPGWEHPVVIVGGDGRRSTASLKGRILGALAVQRCTAISLPVATPTPIAYWSKDRRKPQAVAVITASHSPADWNGLKVMNGPLPPVAEDITDLARPLGDLRVAGAAGRVVEDDQAVEEYLAERRQAFQGQGIERLAVAIDPGSGCQAGVASRLFRALGGRVAAIHDELDGSFARRHPDCAVPGHLAALCEAVKRTGAAVGIAFDGDGDRLALVDGLPRFHLSPDLRLRMPAEEIAALQDRLLTELPAAEVDRTDGVRLVWPEGWLLARRSVTEQAVTLQFEGREARGPSAVVERFLAVFPDLRLRVSDALTRQAR
jgi:phosphomannomutase